MKSFKHFQEDLIAKREIEEVYDPEVQGRSQITKTGEGGRVGRDRKKSEPEKRRMKAIGGGKTAPSASSSFRCSYRCHLSASRKS